MILSLERHLHHAEATVNYYGHPLVGLGSSNDLFTAIHSAAEKLEKQAVKARTKWRDSKRTPNKAGEPESEPSAAGEPEGETEAEAGRRVYRIHNLNGRKPMTLEEAMLAMGANRDYLVYRDTETDRISVLVRRRDGDFDLVEA